MSTKKVIILTIIISTVLLIGMISSIVYSVTQISAAIEEVSETPHISLVPLTSEYTGYVEVTARVSIANNGFYAIRNLVVDITVYGEEWQRSKNLNGDKIGEGHNVIGDIEPGMQWNGELRVNITKHIQQLAVEDCTLRIVIDISLVYQPIVSIPLDYTTEQLAQHNAPYG